MFARHITGSNPIGPVGREELTARLRADVVRLSVARNIWAQPEANAEVRDELRRRLHDLGYEVHEQSQYHNLIALPAPEQRTTDPLDVVAAHYDSVARTPGADDNASALAVLLELAARAARHRHLLALIAFNAEEEQMLGSAAFVAEYELVGRRHDVTFAGFHVLEMLGFTGPEQRAPTGVAEWLGAYGVEIPERGDFVLLAANANSSFMLERALASAQESGDRPPVFAIGLPEDGDQLIPDLLRSDHGPLWRAGIPAILWTDTAELRNPNYHQPTDTPDTLDYTFLARVCELLTRVIGM